MAYLTSLPQQASYDLYLNDSLAYLSKNNTNVTFQNQMLCATSLFECIFLSISLGLLIICTMVGNSFVIAAVILERNLQNSVANYLIVSLASADLTVSFMVMPIAAYIEISDKWYLGSLICDIWTSFDVLCCTASILHLVAIALDRYWAITNVEYAAKRTSRRIVTMIIIIWSVSTTVGISPHIFGLSASKSGVETGVCRLTDNLTFQLVSTFAAFYLPLVFMCVIYWKIFQSAKFRIRKKVFNHPNKKTDSDKTKKNSIRRLKTLLSETTKADSNSETKSGITKVGKQTSIELDDVNKQSVHSSLSNDLTKTINQTDSCNNLVVKQESLVTYFQPHNNKITTSVFQLRDTNEIVNNDTKHEIKIKSKNFNAKKFEQIQNILKKADHVNKSLEMLQNNEIEVENLTLLFKENIYDLAEPHDSDNLLDANKQQETQTESVINDEIVLKKEVGQHSTLPTIIEEKQNGNKLNVSNVNTILKKRAKIDIKRERKAARVLGIIMSCFIICWLPYFCMQIFIAICKDCEFSLLLEKYKIGTILTWSGYLNSLLNPVIYTIFSPDFRESFGKILFGKYRKQRNFKR